MFEPAQSAVSAAPSPSVHAQYDFYVESGHFYQEDMESVPPSPGVSARIADFGTGECLHQAKLRFQLPAS
jgi:hypothetical protein